MCIAVATVPAVMAEALQIGQDTEVGNSPKVMGVPVPIPDTQPTPIQVIKRRSTYLTISSPTLLLGKLQMLS